MGADWYNIGYYEGEGTIVNFSGSEDEFDTLANKLRANSIEYYCIAGSCYEDDFHKTTFFIGKLNRIMGFEVIGPYEIIRYECEFKLVKEMPIDDNVKSVLDGIKKIKICKSGEYKILSSKS